MGRLSWKNLVHDRLRLVVTLTGIVFSLLLVLVQCGLLLGFLLGTIAFAWALLWGHEIALAGVVGLSVVAICTWANTIGSMVPLIARKVGIDPATVSAPLITTLVDATGLAIYLLIAKALLGL